MKYFLQWAVVSVVGLSVVVISSCSSTSSSKNIADEDSTATVPVEVATVKTDDISAYYSNTVTLEADEEAMVVSKVRGIVNKLHVEEGDVVQQGTVLAELEDEQLQLEAKRAKATMDRLENDLNRKKELYKKELISAQEYENAKYEYQAQQSDYELAKLQVKYTHIRAPIAGVISERLIKKGNMINADQEVFQITDFDPLLAVLNVPEHEMEKLQKGQQALIQVDAVANKTFEGKVLRISPTVDSETGTFEVTVSVKDESRRLKPGMFGQVQIVYDTHLNTPTIPKNAIINEDETSNVFVIRNNMAFRKQVQVGYENGNAVEISDGLQPADTVVTVGQSSLQDSALVKIVED
ncbi:RND family efflux transporter, MFP subunit [Fodinibius salinus]|uniref:RND family efflux transporter, MFP subunit n=1 Tax=Fodinibius salinus TaxID=860790 RepID=A0A5D3YPM7_9BACT|nr:efflux RND transporter periplasmic adaptor subunit [Fodinibius salinus]TYP94993.1 RND family efflux transporter, MFP subunit [Fodinibius salinus]